MAELREGLERTIYNKKRKLFKSSASSLLIGSASMGGGPLASGSQSAIFAGRQHHRIPPIQMKFNSPNTVSNPSVDLF